jgi:hypothetical protein
MRIASSRPTWATKTLLKNKNKQIKNNNRKKKIEEEEQEEKGPSQAPI